MTVLADISAGSVLAWDGAVKWPQEHLDALCARAKAALSLGTPKPQSAVLTQPFGTEIFVRAEQDASEVLCSVFAPKAALDTVIEQSRMLCTAILSPENDRRVGS
ncbi:hypothetical protein [Pacificoceanicola onchidii]|uniref:hypothetical protein n=1 Tax=Pacificoceanicola onchidii TaxID=2562685 RepID=UPI0010A4ED21|nr:hypothetical protein [Pacificoceanicola onchidii]